MGSMSMPSHFKMAETSFLRGIFLSIGVITVGPVTIIKAENKKAMGQLNSKIKWEAIPAPKKVTVDPKVMSLDITGPVVAISALFKVRPPSKRITLIARETK